jgi:hypothetical protein
MLSTISQSTTIANGATIWQRPKRYASNLRYNFVFKTQKATISNRWRESFHEYIASCVRAMGEAVESTSGTNGTVCLRVCLNRTSSPDAFARRVKILSARWARRKVGCSEFVWREDYEAETLEPRRQRLEYLKFRLGAN